jgi:hypothetical protein
MMMKCEIIVFDSLTGNKGRDKATICHLFAQFA